MNGPTIRMYRDKDPEARALGGWYVEITTPSPRGPLTHSTDYYRTRQGAAIAGLALAYHLGIPLPGEPAFGEAN